jgi:hypothetical protein
MKKSVMNRILFIILLFFTIFSHTTLVLADGDQSISGIVSGGSSFIEDGEKQTSPITTDKTDDLTEDLYNILFFAGLVLAVIIGIILGIQFMTGSVEQKAKVKDSLIPYVAGCVVIFGAFGIWKLVVTILRGI